MIKSDQRFIEAFKTKQLILSKTLLSSGVTPDLKDPATGEPLVHLSVRTNQPQFLKLLLESQWSPTILNRQGVSPLELSIQLGDFISFEILSRFPVNFLQKDQFGDTLLHLCAFLSRKKHIYLKMADFLIHQGVLPDIKNQRGEIALHRAARYGSSSMIDFLAPKSSIDSFDLDGFTPLHSLCYGVIDENNLLALLKHNPNLNAADRNGQTSLHLISLKNKPKSNDLQAIKILLQHGADPGIVDHQGYTPFQLASMASAQNHEIPKELVSLLKPK